MKRPKQDVLDVKERKKWGKGEKKIGGGGGGREEEKREEEEEEKKESRNIKIEW